MKGNITILIGIAASIGFGLAYFIWEKKQAIQNKPHTHMHIHDNKIAHSHLHSHKDERMYIHLKKSEPDKKITPWILFIIFIFGSCELLIPFIMYPAAKHSTIGIFAIVTISTMLTIVLSFFYGLSLLPAQGIEKYSHTITGLTIFLSRGTIQFLGL